MVAVADGVEHQFDPGRDAQFVEDPEKIFLDGVFTESEFLRNFAVGEALSDQGDDLFFGRCQRAGAASINHAQ